MSQQIFSNKIARYNLPNTIIDGDLQVNGDITATGSISVTPYYNIFGLCANLDLSTTLDNTMMVITGDGTGLNYNNIGEGVFVTVGANITTGGLCSVGYAGNITPGVNNTANGEPTNAVLSRAFADGTYNEITGSWTCPANGIYKFNAELGLARVSGAGERSYYHRFIVDTVPTIGCSTVTDAGGSNFYMGLNNVVILTLTAGQVIQQQIAQTNTGGASVDNMRFQYQLTVQKI